jgi:hypothetical protein
MDLREVAVDALSGGALAYAVAEALDWKDPSGLLLELVPADGCLQKHPTVIGHRPLDDGGFETHDFLPHRQWSIAGFYQDHFNLDVGAESETTFHATWYRDDCAQIWTAVANSRTEAIARVVVKIHRGERVSVPVAMLPEPLDITITETPRSGCPRCGISGIHACPGRVLPPPTPEEEERLTRLLQDTLRKPDLVVSEETYAEFETFLAQELLKYGMNYSPEILKLTRGLTGDYRENKLLHQYWTGWNLAREYSVKP